MDTEAGGQLRARPSKASLLALSDTVGVICVGLKDIQTEAPAEEIYGPDLLGLLNGAIARDRQREIAACA